MPKSRLGQLRDRVDIVTATTTRDEQGGFEATPTTLASSVPAKVSARGGGEQLQIGGVSSRVSYEVEIVYRPDVTPGMHLLWTPYLGTQKRLEVNAVGPVDGRADRILLACTEVA